MPYSYPTPSLAGGIGYTNGRPFEHIIWTWPENTDLQTALANLHAGRCWCGKPSRTRTWWACSPAHTEIWWRQFERWNQLRRRIIERDDFTCRMCRMRNEPHRRTGAPNYDWLEVDHITAVSNGGDFWDTSNLRTLCRPCHRKKTAADGRLRAGRRKRERHHVIGPLETFC